MCAIFWWRFEPCFFFFCRNVISAFSVGPDGDRAIFASKVRDLSHIAEQTDLDNTCDQLHVSEDLGGIVDQSKGSINDEVAIVGHDRTSLGHGHTEIRLLGSQSLQLLKNGSPGKRNDLNRDTLGPL